MNHDYAHCLDYTTDCPKECFRAQLQRDLEGRRSVFIGVPLAYSHLGGTVECKLAKDTNVPCKDTISRQAAIDVLKAIPDYNDGMVFETLSHALRDIELLPSAQRWIPVSERMPEEGWCLCTVHGVFYDHCEILSCRKRKREMCFFLLDDDGEYIDFTGRVMAWMPLPMPWKGADYGIHQ